MGGRDQTNSAFLTTSIREQIGESLAQVDFQRTNAGPNRAVALHANDGYERSLGCPVASCRTTPASADSARLPPEYRGAAPDLHERRLRPYLQWAYRRRLALAAASC